MQQTLGDRSLKRDGYGVVSIDKTNHRYVIERWPRDADPSADSRYPGGPFTPPFASAWRTDQARRHPNWRTSMRIRHIAWVRPVKLVQAGGIAGLSAVGTVIAHAGPGGLADRRWLAAAVLGATMALAGLVLTLKLVLSLRERAESARAGHLTEGSQSVPDAIPFSALVGAMLVCQGCAHYALLTAGAPAHDGPAGSLTLHVLLAIAAAAIVALASRAVRRAAETLAYALALLRSKRRRLRAPLTSEYRRMRRLAGGVRGRAPPVSVLLS
jgi:hypothetical protein